MKKFALFFLFAGISILSLQAQKAVPYMTQPASSINHRQGGAVYRNLYFQFHDGNPGVEVFDLNTRQKVQEIPMTKDPVIHCNNVNFGFQKYSKKDMFPLLYVSSERDARWDVYRVQGKVGQLTLTKVQEIRLPDPKESSCYFPNLIIDHKRKSAWVSVFTSNSWWKPEGNSVKYIQMRVPSIEEGSLVRLDYRDSLSSCTLSRFHVATQGAVVHKGKICQAYGVNKKNNGFLIIDPKDGSIEREWSMSTAGLGDEEPEAAIFWKGKLMSISVLGNHYWVRDFAEVGLLQ